jgi:hypothetical protein
MRPPAMLGGTPLFLKIVVSSSYAGQQCHWTQDGLYKLLLIIVINPEEIDDRKPYKLITNYN